MRQARAFTEHKGQRMFSCVCAMRCGRFKLFLGGYTDDTYTTEYVSSWRWCWFFLYSFCWIISGVVSGVLATWSIITLSCEEGRWREMVCGDAESRRALTVAVTISPTDSSPMTRLTKLIQYTACISAVSMLILIVSFDSCAEWNF